MNEPLKPECLDVPVADNLKRWRERRGLSLSALARDANVSKSTVSELERGDGNPTLDVLYALAGILRIPIEALLSEARIEDAPFVMRLTDAPAVGEQTGSYITRLLSGWMSRGEVELLAITVAIGGQFTSPGHAPGVVERVVCVEGKVKVWNDGLSEVLATGDLITFPSHRPHVYHAVDGAARIIVVQQHPAMH